MDGERRISPVVGYKAIVCSLTESCVNGFTYCWSYYGVHCPRLEERDFWDGAQLVMWIALVVGMLVGFVMICAKGMVAKDRKEVKNR